MQTNYTPIFSVGGKPCGKVGGDTWYKTIAGSRHILRQPPAIAFDLETVNQAERAGAVRVRVTDRETGTLYTASLAHIREAGFSFDRGFGWQIALPLQGWTITRRGEIPARQLDMWQGVTP